MIRAILCLALLASALVLVHGEDINPSVDVLTKNADGEYVKIFGPHGFYFDGHGFGNPLEVINGTIVIGGGH
jgi:hypothetical protein